MEENETTQRPAEDAGAAAEQSVVTPDPVQKTLEQISQGVQDVTNLMQEALGGEPEPAAAPGSPAVAESPAVDGVKETIEGLSRDVQEVTDMIREANPELQTPPDGPAAGGAGDAYSDVLVAHHDRGGSITEEYRTLRTNLLARCPEDRFCFLVTSAEPGEGKTVTCLNLAFVMAERLDQRTIIVDVNLRGGQLAELLKAPGCPGVADYLAGRAALSEIVHPTACPNVFFVPAGAMGKAQAGELLGRAQLKTLVDQLRQDYDYVLIDTPPINRFADAGVAGLATGDALLVVRLNRTPREAVEQAVQSLRNANVNLVGLVTTHHRRQFLN